MIKNKLKCSNCSNNSLKFDSQYNKLKYYKCSNCGILVLQNPLGLSESNELYSKDKAIGDDKNTNRLLYFLMKIPLGKHAFNLLRHVIYYSRANALPQRKSTLLDVGCGTGEFLYYANKLGWKTFGLEISKTLVGNAAKYSKSKIYKGSLSSYKREKKYSVITLWHVFEHLHHPQKVIVKLKKILTKNGTLIIEVPHANSLSYKIFKNRWTLLLAPQHLHFWTKSSFVHLLKPYKLKIVKVEYPVSFPFVVISSLVKLNHSFALLTPFLIPVALVLAYILSKLEYGEVIRVYVKKV